MPTYAGGNQIIKSDSQNNSNHQPSAFAIFPPPHTIASSHSDDHVAREIATWLLFVNDENL